MELYKNLPRLRQTKIRLIILYLNGSGALKGYIFIKYFPRLKTIS